jgi:hypothetical protein
MFPIVIRDPGTGTGQRVTTNGESVTGLLGYSEPYYSRLEIDDQVYNVVPGLAGRRFLMTGILIATTRNIVGEKQVDLYESLLATTDIHDKDILIIDMQKSERVYLPLVNVATQEGRHINAHAEDSEVDITIFGYYVRA